MPRYTPILWYCVNQHRNDPADRRCVTCGALHYERHAVVAAGERAVVDINRRTGDVSVPGRADVPLHAKQIRDGYERVEVTSALGGGFNDGVSMSFLESKGLVHEKTNWHNDVLPDPEVGVPERASLRDLGLD